MEATKLHASHLIDIQVAVNSFLLYKENQCEDQITKSNESKQSSEQFRKNVSINLPTRLSQVGDDQLPYNYYVGDQFEQSWP